MRLLPITLILCILAGAVTAQVMPISRQQILDHAWSAVSSPYVWGGSNWDPADRNWGGADCSGLVGKAWAINSWVPYKQAYHPYSTIHFIGTPGPAWFECGIGNLISGDAIVYRYSDNSGGHTYIFAAGDPWGSHLTLEAAGSSIGIVNRWRTLPSSYSQLKGIRRVQLIENHQVSDHVVESEDGSPTFTTSAPFSTSGYDSYAPYTQDGSVAYAWVTTASADVATFRPNLPAQGLYEILVTCNQASPNVDGVRVTTHHAGGADTAIWNQSTAGLNQWLPMGGPVLMRAGTVDAVEWSDALAQPRDGSHIFRADATMFRLSNEVVVDGIGGSVGTFATLSAAVSWLNANRSIDPDVVSITTDLLVEPGPLHLDMLDHLRIVGDADGNGIPCTVVVPPGPVPGLSYPCGVYAQLSQEASWKLSDLVFVPPHHGAGVVTSAPALVVGNQRLDTKHNGYQLELERVTLTGSLGGDVPASSDSDLRSSCTRWGGGTGTETGVMVLRYNASAGDGLWQQLTLRDVTIAQGATRGLTLNAGATQVRVEERCRIAWNSGDGLAFLSGAYSTLSLAGGSGGDRVVIANNDDNGILIDAPLAPAASVTISGCNVLGNGSGSAQAGLVTDSPLSLVEDCIFALNGRYNWYHRAAGTSSTPLLVNVRRCTFHDAVYPAGDTSPLCLSSLADHANIQLTDCILSGAPETPGYLDAIYVSTSAVGATVALGYSALVQSGPHALTGNGIRVGQAQVSQSMVVSADPFYLSVDPSAQAFLTVTAPSFGSASSNGGPLCGGGAEQGGAAHVQAFGTGCPGAGGFTPFIGTAGGLPSPGNTGFSIFMLGANGGVPTTLLVGLSDTFSPTLNLPLPLDLSVIGLPGCTLLTDPTPLLPWFNTMGSAPGLGSALMLLPIPASPGLLSGLHIYLQWAVLDPQVTGGVTLSNGLHVWWN